MKKLSALLLFIILFLALTPTIALANAPKPSDIDIIIYDVPKDATVDIMINETHLPLDEPSDKHEASDAHKKFHADDYYALYPRSSGIQYNIRRDSKNNHSYLQLKLDFTFSSKAKPDDFIVMVIDKDDNIITSEVIDYHNTHDLRYTEDGLEKSNKRRPNSPYANAFIMFIVLSLALPLVFTIVVEVVVAIIMKIKRKVLIALVNLVTNFIMNIILMFGLFLPSLPYIVIVLILEIIVIGIEFLIYRSALKEHHTTKKILLYTVIANASSCVLYMIALQFLS